MTMMKVAKCLLLGLVALGAGCASSGDAEECVGLQCPTGFQWPMGGEVRLWYIELPDGSTIRYFIGYFVEEQDPDILPDQAVGYCEPSPEAIRGLGYGNTFTEMDVGDHIIYHVGDEEFIVPRVTATGGEQVIDFAGRPHDIVYLLEVVDPPSPGFFNAHHRVTVPGRPEFTEVLTPGLYMPPESRVITPVGTPVVTFQPGQDVNIEWEEIEENTDEIVTVGAMVIQPDNFGEVISCLVTNNGQTTIPGDIIDGLDEDTGVLVIGTAADESVLRPDGRLHHPFGLNCHLYPYQRL